MRDPLFAVMYKRALRFLGIRLRSEKEMRQKIAEWLYRNEMEDSRKRDIEQQIIDQLVKDHYLNDVRFAEEWVRSRVRNKPRGEMVLRMELAQKGISRDLIDDVLGNLKNSNAEEGDALLDGALKLGEKYARRLSGEEDRMFVLKLSQALARKGFDSGIVKRVVDVMIAKRYN